MGASRLLGDAQVAVTILLDQGGTITQPASNGRGIEEGGSGVGLVSDDNDWVLQGAVPRTGKPFDSTDGPFVAKVARLGELDTD